MGALSHLRVLDLSRVLAGPWAGQVLADLGAEVVKVESPEGDDTRKWGPPFVENADGTPHVADGGGLAAFLARQRGLQLVVLNACATEGHVRALLDAGVPAVIEDA